MIARHPRRIIVTTPTEHNNEDTGEDTGDESRRTDPEILALSAMLRTLRGLDPRAKARIVAWLYDRFWTSIPPF